MLWATPFPLPLSVLQVLAQTALPQVSRPQSPDWVKCPVTLITLGNVAS